MKNKAEEKKDMRNRRSETRRVADEFHSVEVSISGMAPAYVYKLRDISSMGMSVVVKEGSDLLNLIEIGDILDMKFNPNEASDPVEYFKTEIRHITKDAQGRFRDHFIVGLSVLESTIDVS